MESSAKRQDQAHLQSWLIMNDKRISARTYRICAWSLKISTDANLKRQGRSEQNTQGHWCWSLRRARDDIGRSRTREHHWIIVSTLILHFESSLCVQALLVYAAYRLIEGMYLFSGSYIIRWSGSSWARVILQTKQPASSEQTVLRLRGGGNQ